MNASGMEMQVKLVGTGWYASVDEYLCSARCNADGVALVVDRDGSVVRVKDGLVIALMNAGPVVQVGEKWMPAVMGSDGKPATIIGSTPVRVPYEYCSCHKYHGFQHYEMMGKRQIQSLRRVVGDMLQQYSISYPYDNLLGEICPRAIEGGSGVYFASSYDRNRNDIHPQVDVINIIKEFSSL